MVEIKVPKSTSNDQEVFISEWKFSDFDYVKKGQHIVSIETSKVVEEINADEDGYLQVFFLNDARVKPGQVIGVISKNKENKLESLKNIESKLDFNFTLKAKKYLDINKIKLTDNQLEKLKNKNLISEKDIIEVINYSKKNLPEFNNQIIILIKEEMPYHAAVYFSNYGIIDLSLLGSKISSLDKYNFNDCKCKFFEINTKLFEVEKAIRFFEKPCLLTDKIIKKEKSQRGWFKTTESADYILNFRKIRSKNIEDMNCIEWLLYGLELGGMKISKNILTARKLLEWCYKNLKEIKVSENKLFLKSTNK